jgi:hypothetical protein
MTLNERISKICQEKKVKQNDLVKQGFGSKQTIHGILNGKQKPNTQFIESFLMTYKDVNARWLLTGEEDREKVEDPRAQYGFCKECIKKEGVIEHLKKECQAKDRRILELEIKIAGAEGRVKSQAG